MTALPPSSFGPSPGKLPGQDWLDQIFHAKSVGRGGVVRRKLCDVEREVGRRGFHMLQSGEQVIILCSPTPENLLEDFCHFAPVFF